MEIILNSVLATSILLAVLMAASLLFSRMQNARDRGGQYKVQRVNKKRE